jgi:hypothetical protein
MRAKSLRGVRRVSGRIKRSAQLRCNCCRSDPGEHCTDRAVAVALDDSRLRSSGSSSRTALMLVMPRCLCGARADCNPKVGSCQHRGGVSAVAHQWPPCDGRAAARRPPGIVGGQHLVLRPEIAAITMAGSSLIVAVNALSLKRLRLPAASSAASQRGGHRLAPPSALKRGAASGGPDRSAVR